MKRIYHLLGLSLVALGALFAYTQGQKPLDPFEEAMRQRQMYLETFGVLPGELYVEEGKELFFRKGPSGKTLEACDFGKGPGVLEGAYAQLPKYFPDSKRVEDLETRIHTCMQTVQGYKPQEIKRDEVRAITAYVASFSSKARMQVVPKHPAELAMYNLGRELWYWRAGNRDMNCAACHDRYAGQRVRLSPLRSPSQGLGSEWPAYRFEADKLYTMQDRLAFCYESSVSLNPLTTPSPTSPSPSTSWPRPPRPGTALRSCPSSRGRYAPPGPPPCLSLPGPSPRPGGGGRKLDGGLRGLHPKGPPASYLVYPTEANDLLLFEPLVLDVRTLEERKRGHIPGSVHIYAGEVPKRLGELPKDKEALVLVYCNSGSVSMVIAAYLQALGYKNAKNIAHGFKGWLDAGLPVEVEG
jgi:sulfur-oxidizing protein SoxA